MPVPRWWWVCNATPGSRVSALSKPDETSQAVELPAPDQTPTFAQHIKGLFRKMDRESMKFAFDLWTYEDVKKHGAAILSRLQAGTMPCDGAWPPERVSVFERWIRAGMPE
jgi:hypothetical protein